MNLKERIKLYQDGEIEVFDDIYSCLDKFLRNIKFKFNNIEIYDVVICSIHTLILKIDISKFSDGDNDHIINYIKKSLMNIALDELKRIKKEKNLISYNSEFTMLSMNTLFNSYFDNYNIEFKDLIKNLDEREQFVIKRFFMDQDSIIDIAKDLNLSRQFVNRIKNNALKKLKKEIILI